MECGIPVDALVGSELEFTVGGWSNEWLYVVDGCWTVGGTFDEWLCERKQFLTNIIMIPHTKSIKKIIVPRIEPMIIPTLLPLELGLEGLEVLVSAVVTIIATVN